MYLENEDLQRDILSREQAQKAHWYLAKLRELFRAKQHERDSEVFEKATQMRTSATAIQSWLASEYDLNYIDSSYV